jgi:hypothetical protein
MGLRVAGAQCEQALSRRAARGHRWNSAANGMLFAEAAGLPTDPACQSPVHAMPHDLRTETGGIEQGAHRVRQFPLHRTGKLLSRTTEQ